MILLSHILRTLKIYEKKSLLHIYLIKNTVKIVKYYSSVNHLFYM